MSRKIADEELFFDWSLREAACFPLPDGDTMGVQAANAAPTAGPGNRGMIDYQIQPNTRHCSATGRELRPGERYHGVLREEGDRLIRQDYSAEAWTGPPADAFSHWCGRVPADRDSQQPRFDDDALEECFQSLETANEPSRINFRYVVALLLIRRKRLRFEHSVEENGVERLQVCHVRTGVRSLVVNPQLSDEQMAEVQAEVFRVLGWN